MDDRAAEHNLLVTIAEAAGTLSQVGYKFPTSTGLAPRENVTRMEGGFKGVPCPAGAGAGTGVGG